jgi:hypothetical protein
VAGNAQACENAKLASSVAELEDSDRVGMHHWCCQLDLNQHPRPCRRPGASAWRELDGDDCRRDAGAQHIASECRLGSLPRARGRTKVATIVATS